MEFVYKIKVMSDIRLIQEEEQTTRGGGKVPTPNPNNDVVKYIVIGFIIFMVGMIIANIL